MIHIKNEKDCCGCGACAVSCPTKAIEMEAKGSLGALLPTVNTEKCVECGLCQRVCPKLDNDTEKVDFAQAAIAAYSKDKELKFASSSGGMFLSFAKKCINKGYSVYGAAFDSEMKLKCTCAQHEEELYLLAKSKYLQSDMTGSFMEIEEKLKNGQGVLFVSTPCQVLALKKYLKKTYEHLLTVDFFCHGVPSQLLFDECNGFEDNLHNRKTIEYSFRAKVKNGVTPHYYKIRYEKNGKEKQEVKFYYKSLFYALFQQYITLRESCYDCTFATERRYSDITIGDFHEIDKYVKGINRFDGVSTVILNTQKGKDLFESVSDGLEVFPVDINTLKSDGTIFCGGTKRPGNRDQLIQDYNEKGISYIHKNYFGAKKYLKQSVYYHMPSFIRGVLKRLI